MKKEMIWIFYAVLIIVLGVIGYFVGKKNQKTELYTSIGVVVGTVISILLWVSVGEKISQ